MKFLVNSLIILSALVSTHVFAVETDNFADNGFYVVGQVGSGKVDKGFLDDFMGSTKLTNNSGFAGRLGVGYQLNRYFALEGGLAAYPSAVRDYDNARGLNLWGVGTKRVGSSDINGIYSIDMMGMARLPIGNYFFVGAGAGLAVMQFNYSAMHVTNADSTSPNWEAGSANFIAPKAELRLGSKVNQQTTVYLSTSYIFSVNGTNPNVRNYQPGLSMIAVGVNYSL